MKVVTEVILRRVPDTSQHELVELDLPRAKVSHVFEHEGAEWVIIGSLKRENTKLPVRGNSARLAVPRWW